MARRRRKPAALEPAVKAALYGCDHRIVVDIRGRYERYGSLSPKQAALVVKLANEGAKREAEFAARAAKLAANGVAVPTGPTVIEGEVVSAKWKDGRFPGYKWLVEDTSGWRVWGSVPSALIDDDRCSVVRGDRVRFTATVKPSDDDAAFGFATRPRKAEVLPSEARAVAELFVALGDYGKVYTGRREKAAAATGGAIFWLGHYAHPGPRAVVKAVAALGRWYRSIYGPCKNAGNGNGRCYGGWIRHYSTEYPCGSCKERGERIAAWNAKVAEVRAP